MDENNWFRIRECTTLSQVSNHHPGDYVAPNGAFLDIGRAVSKNIARLRRSFLEPRQGLDVVRPAWALTYE